MKPEESDKILAQAAQRALPPDEGRAAIARVKSTLLLDLRPVRTLAPLWAFASIFVALFAAFALASASALGLHGIRVLSLAQRWSIFPLLLAVATLAAMGCARAMRPAAGAPLGWLALVSAAGAFPALFSLIFRGYGTQEFVHEGVPCLVAGLCVAIPTGVVIAWILRRGFVLDWTRSGLAAGVLAGLAGLCMLELHCPNLKAIHIIVWHVAVVMVSGLLGLALGSLADYFRRG